MASVTEMEVHVKRLKINSTKRKEGVRSINNDMLIEILLSVIKHGYPTHNFNGSLRCCRRAKVFLNHLTLIVQDTGALSKSHKL